MAQPEMSHPNLIRHGNKPSPHTELLCQRLTQLHRTYAYAWIAGLIGPKPTHCRKMGSDRTMPLYVKRLPTVS